MACLLLLFFSNGCKSKHNLSIITPILFFKNFLKREQRDNVSTKDYDDSTKLCHDTNSILKLKILGVWGFVCVCVLLFCFVWGP